MEKAEIRKKFIEALTEDFKKKVPDFAKLQEIVENEIGGQFVNDHAAIRVADPEVAELLKQAMALMDFEPVGEYHFPDKKLKSFAYHVKGNHGDFSLFQSNVDLENIPENVREAIIEDNSRIAAASDHSRLKEFIAKGSVEDSEVDEFIGCIVNNILSRNGVPVKRSTMDLISKEVSPVLAAGIALGPDINHITIDLKLAGFKSIDHAYERMSKDFNMLDEIKRAPGGMLDQSAAKPTPEEFVVLEDDGTIGKAVAGLRFAEIIWREKVTEDNKDLCGVPAPVGQDYPYFESANATKLFEGAKL